MTAKITLYLHAVQYPGACTSCARTTEVGQDYRTMHNGQDHSSVCTKCPHRRLSRIVRCAARGRSWPDRREGQKEMGRVSPDRAPPHGGAERCIDGPRPTSMCCACSEVDQCFHFCLLSVVLRLWFMICSKW